MPSVLTLISLPFLILTSGRVIYPGLVVSEVFQIREIYKKTEAYLCLFHFNQF